jgi:GNAT superfamily N-acetyltransferase
VVDSAAVREPSSWGGMTVGRKLTPLTVQTLGSIPDPCRRCVFWELGPRAHPRGSDEAAVQKEAWLSSVMLEWGPVGHVLTVDGVVAAYSLYAPASFLEQAKAQVARPVSRDAVLLATLAVLPEFEGQGIGKVLLQSMARDLTRRKVRAVEAFADRAWSTRACHLPAGFLEASGFQVVREHPRFPLMRMDLRTVLRWRDAREAALEVLRVPVPAQPALRPVPTVPKPSRFE